MRAKEKMKAKTEPVRKKPGPGLGVKRGQESGRERPAKCPACGKPVGDGSKVCPVCGANLDPGAPRQV